MKNVPLDYRSFRSFDDGTTAEESTIFNLGEDGALYFYYGGIKIFILIKEKILDVSRVYLQAFDRLDCFTPSNVRESRRVFARTTILAKFECHHNISQILENLVRRGLVTSPRIITRRARN